MPLSFISRAVALTIPVAIVLFGCDDSSENQTAQPDQTASQQPVPVGIVEIQPEAVTIGETFIGRIAANQKVEVRSRVSGFIEARLFNEGQTVTRGQKLFRIERDTYEAIVAQRRADLAAAEAKAENADLQLRRAQELSRRDNIAQATVDERQAAARSSHAAVLQAQAELRQAEINLGYTDITAPIAGRTGRANFDVGALVGPESGPLVEIVSDDPVYVVFPVSQRRLLEAQKQAGEKGLHTEDFVVYLRFSNGSRYPHPGRIDFISSTVQRSTDTVDIRAVLPNPQGLLRDGQFVQVTIESAQPETALVVPQSAVQADRQGAFVLVVTPENRIDVRRVETGDTLERGRVTVRAGLNAGDRVVVQGLQRVRPGTPVDARPVEPVTDGL